MRRRVVRDVSTPRALRGIAYPLTYGEHEAIVCARGAFQQSGPCWTSKALGLFYVSWPVAPLTPRQRAAVKALRRFRWRTISSSEYTLGRGEWFVE